MRQAQRYSFQNCFSSETLETKCLSKEEQKKYNDYITVLTATWWAKPWVRPLEQGIDVKLYVIYEQKYSVSPEIMFTSETTHMKDFKGCKTSALSGNLKGSN